MKLRSAERKAAKTFQKYSSSSISPKINSCNNSQIVEICNNFFQFSFCLSPACHKWARAQHPTPFSIFPASSPPGAGSFFLRSISLAFGSLIYSTFNPFNASIPLFSFPKTRIRLCPVFGIANCGWSDQTSFFASLLRLTFPATTPCPHQLPLFAYPILSSQRLHTISLSPIQIRVLHEKNLTLLDTLSEAKARAIVSHICARTLHKARKDLSLAHL